MASASKIRGLHFVHLVLLERSLTDHAEFHQRGLGSVFMTAGDAVTQWSPQIFRAVNLESYWMKRNIRGVSGSRQYFCCGASTRCHS